MKNTLLFFPIVLISICMSCQPKAPDQPMDHKEEKAGFDKAWATRFLDSVNTKFTEQFRAKDSVALAGYYWPDAELLFSNSEPIKGDKILSTYGSMTRMGVQDFTFVTTDIVGSDDLMVETGSYEMKDAKGGLVDRGKYLVVWQKRDGVWKLYRDTGNTSMPEAK